MRRYEAQPSASLIEKGKARWVIEWTTAIAAWPVANESDRPVIYTFHSDLTERKYQKRKNTTKVAVLETILKQDRSYFILESLFVQQRVQCVESAKVRIRVRLYFMYCESWKESNMGAARLRGFGTQNGTVETNIGR